MRSADVRFRDLWKPHQYFLLMELRRYPMISYRGRPSWPPVWTAASPGAQSRPLPRGEPGILSEVRYYPSLPGRIYLLIHHNTDPYVGCLMIDDRAFCELLAGRLKDHCGVALTEIGGLDLPEAFAK